MGWEERLRASSSEFAGTSPSLRGGRPVSMTGFASTRSPREPTMKVVGGVKGGGFLKTQSSFGQLTWCPHLGHILFLRRSLAGRKPQLRGNCLSEKEKVFDFANSINVRGSESRYTMVTEKVF